MYRYILSIIQIIAVSLTVHGAITVDGSQFKVITEKPDASTGLDEVVVVYNTEGVKLSYTSTSSTTVKWSKFGNMGGGYAEPITSVTYSGLISTIDASKEDAGYIIEDTGRFYYFWVVNYANHYMTANNLTVGPESDCSMAQLLFSGTAGHIYYYSINGRQMELNRDIEIAYNTLRFDENTEYYRLEPVSELLSSISGESIHIPSPLCNTTFSLTGDRFLKAWGKQVSITSNEMNAIAVEATTRATEELRDVPNEKRAENGDAMGGSAPCEVRFRAEVTDAAVFTEWQFSQTQDFEEITLRMSEKEIDYTFREEGNTYVRFVCANASGSCEYYGDVYTISIGESALDCPNAFSPGASEGVNDEWRVSYKSIVSFECHIFNRAGVKMISLTDPSQGWDGKYGGKVVPAGVYFYVIKAMGADGKEYKLSGDINVINYK